jgi:flagellar motor switch protein FliM
VEVLSQSQIDDLLNSLTTGAMDLEAEAEDNAKKVKEYDFRTPKRFTKEQLKIVSSVYENFSRLLSSYLTGMLRLYVEVECVHIEETRYADFNNALPDSVLASLGEIRFSGGNEDDNTIMLEINKGIGFAIMERLLGGTGDGLDVDREFTEIEVSLLENVFKGAYPQMSDAWSNYFEMDVLFRRVETNARLMQAVGAEDTVVVVMLDIHMRELQGTASVCVTAACLEDILKKIDSQYARNLKRINSAGDKERRELVMQYLQDSDLEMRCVIGETQVNLKDIFYLSVGDVIQLSKPIDSLIDLDVGRSCWFKGKMGPQRGKKAIQINQVL